MPGSAGRACTKHLARMAIPACDCAEGGSRAWRPPACSGGIGILASSAFGPRRRRFPWPSGADRVPGGLTSSMDGTPKGPAGPLSRVDHLVYAAPDLQRGIEEIEELLGVRAI